MHQDHSEDCVPTLNAQLDVHSNHIAWMPFQSKCWRHNVFSMLLSLTYLMLWQCKSIKVSMSQFPLIPGSSCACPQVRNSLLSSHTMAVLNHCCLNGLQMIPDTIKRSFVPCKWLCHSSASALHTLHWLRASTAQGCHKQFLCSDHCALWDNASTCPRASCTLLVQCRKQEACKAKRDTSF